MVEFGFLFYASPTHEQAHIHTPSQTVTRGTHPHLQGFFLVIQWTR